MLGRTGYDDDGNVFSLAVTACVVLVCYVEVQRADFSWVMMLTFLLILYVPVGDFHKSELSNEPLQLELVCLVGAQQAHACCCGSKGRR